MGDTKEYRKRFKQATKDGKVARRQTKHVAEEYQIPEELVAFWRLKKSYVAYDDAIHKACASARTRMVNVREGEDDYIPSVSDMREYLGHIRLCDLCRWYLSDKPISIDHDKPLARGGTNSLSNLLLVHTRCNQAKGALTGHQYRNMVKALPLLSGWDDEATKDIIARLIAGGARRFG